MNASAQPPALAPAGLEEALRRLEARVSRLEAYLHLEPPPVRDESGTLGSDTPEPAISSREAEEAKAAVLELKIGEFWLARVGIVALLLGTAFFISYPVSILSPLAHSCIGYFAVAGLFALAHWGRAAYPFLSRILFGGGLLLLYYATLRLHFFTGQPLLPQRALALVCLMIVVAVHFYFAARHRRQFLASVALVLGHATALVGDATHFTLPLVAVTSAAAIYFLLKYRFQTMALISVVLAYTMHLLWLLNNPLLGHALQAVGEHQYNLVYLFVYAAIFALPTLLRAEDAYPEATKVLLPLLNGLGFTGLTFLVVLTFFEHAPASPYFLIAVYLLLFATTSWVRRGSRFATSFYASFGYLALSAAIFARFPAPHFFIWLGWQSLLVISTAIWFRSKILVVANTLIYLGIFLAYLISVPSNPVVNFSYAVVALLSARLLNWKTERLALKTELMRNLYLASAFLIIPYGLYHVVLRNYVSLSWLGAALFYFLMSLMLKNKKYRWMAILTLFLAVLYVFAFDLARLEPGYRILSFLALGVVLLVTSLLYARSRKKNVVSP